MLRSGQEILATHRWSERVSRRKDKSHDRYIPSREGVRRQLDKGNAREALKEAKLCFRTEAIAENRALLEEAFLVRIQQLHHVQQLTDAKAVLADLVAFRPTTPGVLEGVARLRVLLGEMGSSTNAALEADPSLLIEIADRAVLNKNLAVPNYADLPLHLTAVREALLAVEAGDDNRAIELLAVISRGSPLSDWRLFVRGLSAFYTRDNERAEANWSRLEAGRPAMRIARSLMLAANLPGSAEEKTDISAIDGVRRLELTSEAGPLITLLTQLSVEWQQQNWKPFFRTYRLLQQRYTSSHEKIVRQVVDLVWKWAVRNSSAAVLDELAAIGPAPEFDPLWNRSRALLAEHPDDPSSLDDVELKWVAYVADLQQLDFLSEAEKSISAGFVYHHIAEVFQCHAESFDTEGFDFDAEDAAIADRLVRAAIRYFERSIAVCPQLESSYLHLVKHYEQSEEIEKAAGVMKNLIKSQPDSFEAASWMASYQLSKDNPGEAAGYLRTAQRLRPRDPLIAALTWNQKLTMARGLVLKRQFEAARQEINDAAELNSADNDPCALDLFRAGIELKAGNPDGAQLHLDTALAKLEESAFIWMQMSLAAILRLETSVRREFDDRLSKEITKPVTSDTAGRIARFLVRMRTTQTAYVGRAGHERLLTKYLKRAEEISWQAEDLKSVCEFLRYFPTQKRFRSDLLDLGVAKFPIVPHFAYWVGMELLHRQHTAQNELRIEESFSSAIRNHNSGPSKLTAQELEIAMTNLSTVKDRIEQQHRYDHFMTSEEAGDFNSADGGAFGTVSGDAEGFQIPPAMLQMLGMGTDEDGAADDGAAIACFEPAILAMIERSMPPDVRSTVLEIAESDGLTFQEAMLEVLAAVAKNMQHEAGETSRQRPMPSGRSRGTGRKRS